MHQNQPWELPTQPRHGGARGKSFQQQAADANGANDQAPAVAASVLLNLALSLKKHFEWRGYHFTVDSGSGTNSGPDGSDSSSQLADSVASSSSSSQQQVVATPASVPVPVPAPVAPYSAGVAATPAPTTGPLIDTDTDTDNGSGTSVPTPLQSVRASLSGRFGVTEAEEAEAGEYQDGAGPEPLLLPLPLAPQPACL